MSGAPTIESYAEAWENALDAMRRLKVAYDSNSKAGFRIPRVGAVILVLVQELGGSEGYHLSLALSELVDRNPWLTGQERKGIQCAIAQLEHRLGFAQAGDAHQHAERQFREDRA